MPKKRLAEVVILIEEREFEETSRRINDLPVDYQYNARALSLLNEFEAQYPNSERVAELKQMITDIVAMVDDMDYETLTNIPSGDLDARLEAYSNYLSNHPEGKYRSQVSQLTAGLSVKAFRDLKANVKKLEKKRQYDKAIDICKRYRTLFPDSQRLADVRLIQAGLEDKKDLVELRRLAEKKGRDYEAARRLFVDYLDNNPQTSQVGNIEKEIALFDQKIRSRSEWQKMVAYSRNPGYKASDRIRRIQRFIQKNPGSPFKKEAQQIVAQLEAEAREEDQRSRAAAQQQQVRAQAQQAEEQRRQEHLRQQQAAESVMAQLKATQGRYVAAGKEIVRDTQTGLMWATLDSHLALGRCVSYDRALQYVRALRNGGYSDWRLPTSAELAAIYKNHPFFPDSGAKWYWTSETYVKGYNKIANIVTTKRETVFKREYFELDRCGAVRAVRP